MSGAMRGRADRAPVAGAAVGAAHDDAGLRQPGQRRPHRLDRSADHQPVARVPRHLRGRPGADSADRARGALILDEFTSFAVGNLRPGPAARHPVHHRQDRGQGPDRVRPADPPGRGPLRQRRGPGRAPATPSRPTRPASPRGRRRARTTTYYFGTGGIADHRGGPGRRASASLVLDPTVRPATSLPPGGNPWAADPAWDWTTVPAADGRRLPDRPVHHGHHDRRAGHARPVGRVGDARRGLPGDRHRGATRAPTRRST